MTRPQERIRYQYQHQPDKTNQYSSIQYGNTDQKDERSFIVGTPPSFVINHGQNLQYSPGINSTLIGTPPPHVTYPHTQFVQGSIPVITRPYVQGPVLSSTVNSINPGATIIQAPTPIIKPVVYRTVETNQHQETIQQLVNQYTLLYNKYQQLKSKNGHQEQPNIPNPNSKTIIKKKTQATHMIFSKMSQQVDRMLNKVFSQRLSQGQSSISRITNDGMNQIDQIRFY